VKVAFLGATRGMGRALARGLAARGDALFLLGRHADELARSARDLELRGAPGTVGTGLCDLLDGLVIDRADRAARTALASTGIGVRVTPAVMRSLADRERLARDCLAFAAELRAGAALRR